MIRVAIFDRHPTVRAGVDALLCAQPDLVHVGSAADRYELFALLQRMRPDVVALDHRPGSDGLIQSRAAARLAPQDRAILAMRLAGTSASDMAAAVGLCTSALRARLAAIVAILGGAAEPLPGGPLRAAA